MSGEGYWDRAATSSSRDSGGYWQGIYRGPAGERDGGGQAADSDEGKGASQPETGGSGSMSSRARRAYAAEALRSKDHISAGLLAIFLGMFGIHKFYLGCNQAGFIMLAVSIIGGILTFGLAAAVMWVIAIIEGAIYLMKSQRDFDRIYVLNQRDWF